MIEILKFYFVIILVLLSLLFLRRSSYDQTNIFGKVLQFLNYFGIKARIFLAPVFPRELPFVTVNTMKNTWSLFQIKFITEYSNVQHIIITQI
jgi:hypothetical protein